MRNLDTSTPPQVEPAKSEQMGRLTRIQPARAGARGQSRVSPRSGLDQRPSGVHDCGNAARTMSAWAYRIAPCHGRGPQDADPGPVTQLPRIDEIRPNERKCTNPVGSAAEDPRRPRPAHKTSVGCSGKGCLIDMSGAESVRVASLPIALCSVPSCRCCLYVACGRK